MATARSLAKMTPEEIEEKVGALSPAWAKDYIRRLEGLTRALAAQLQAAQAMDGGLTQANVIQAAGNGQVIEADPAPHFHTPDELGGATADRVRTHIAVAHYGHQGLTGWDVGRLHAYHNGLHDGYVTGRRSVPPFPAPAGEYATVRVVDGQANMEPVADLPDKAEIRFADFYQVHYGGHETTGGMRLLVVEADGPIQVRPVNQATVLIARGEYSNQEQG